MCNNNQLLETRRVAPGFLAIFAALLLTLGACQSSDNGPAPTGSQNMGNNNTGNNAGNNNTGNQNTGNSNSGDGKPAPDFSLQSINGNTVKLSNYKGKVVVLFFLGNTCPSCIAAAPSVEDKLDAPYISNTNYAILGLDQWDGNKASLESFKTTTGVNFPLLLKASSVASDYGTTYDRLVVINKEGNIAFKGSQSASGDLSSVEDLVNSLL